MLHGLLNVVFKEIDRGVNHAPACISHRIRRINPLRNLFHPFREGLLTPCLRKIVDEAFPHDGEQGDVVFFVKFHLTVERREIELSALSLHRRPVNSANSAVMVAQNATADS